MITEIIYCMDLEAFDYVVKKAKKMGYSWRQEMTNGEWSALGMALGSGCGISLILNSNKTMIYVFGEAPTISKAAEWLKGEE